MATQIKYIHLVGIEKKEAILIQSFLNLAKGEMDVEYQVDEAHKQRPDLYIVDEIAHHDDINRGNEHAEILVVGDDTNFDDWGYLHRPLQWSRFKSSLDKIHEKSIGNVVGDLSVEKSAEVLEIEGAAEDQSAVKSFRADTEYNVDQTVSAESTVHSSERSTRKQATKTQTVEQTSEQSVEATTSYADSPTIVELAHSRVVVEKQSFEQEELDRLGTKIEFWEDEDCQVIVKDRPVLFVKADKGMVYSEYSFLDWEILLRSKDVRKTALPEEWAPTGRVRSYPLHWLTWFSSHARSKGYLDSELNKEHFFLLDKWPEFDLLYNSNDHLKICGLLFKEGHSIQELVSKTHLRARIIIGLLNACHKMGVLSSFPDKDSARHRGSDDPIDTHSVMSLLTKVFKN